MYFRDPETKINPHLFCFSEILIKPPFPASPTQAGKLAGRLPYFNFIIGFFLLDFLYFCTLK
jgi:hypothetical protein